MSEHTSLTPQEIAEIKALCQPWQEWSHAAEQGEGTVMVASTGWVVCDAGSEAEAAKIILAHNTLPHLISDLAAAQKREERLTDLVRYCRDTLHQEELITDEEFSEILQVPGAVDRLEGYDKMRAERDTARAQGKAQALDEALAIIKRMPHESPGSPVRWIKEQLTRLQQDLPLDSD